LEEKIMAQSSIIKLMVQRPQELMVAAGIVTILGVMVMPIPTVFLDLMLSFSLTFSLIVLMVAVFMLSPLEFSVFPSLLLIITLLRLSLNIASTRIILLNGDQGAAAAGQVIESFGSFVVGGNYVVGTVIFIILVMINFIVITKGSVRTSEVAARFTLDAIPGKQMSIDADLNAGLITDGSIRFVRGDAIAGILITLVNIIGGFAIGVFQQGMDASEAAQVYTLLTIGDGLVSQLPALVVSTAAGLVVTRAQSDKNLPGELVKQMLNQPYAFVIASGILFFFGLIPGLPHFPFLLMSLLAGYIAFYKIRDNEKVEQKQIRKKEDEARVPLPEKVESILPLDIMEMEVGYELIPLVDADRNGELLERIKSIRRQFALEMGFIVPPLHIRDNLQLKSNEYAVLIKGVDIARGSIMMGRILAMNPGTTDREIEGIKTTEPTFGLPAVWVSSSKKQEAQLAGYTVVDPATVITTHIKETIKRHAHEIMGRQETQALLDKFKETNPKVVEELIPNSLSLGKVQRVLQNLLREQISIRDLRTILEKLSDYSSLTQDPDVLTEYVRQGLARPITKQYQSNDGTLSVITLDRGIEDAIEGSIQKSETGAFLALEPNVAERFLTRLKAMIEKITPNIETSPVLLASPGLRMHIRKFTERFLPDLVIISHSEVASSVQIKNLGVVDLNAN
jgi:flagellar biosynthesis protein FlhA